MALNKKIGIIRPAIAWQLTPVSVLLDYMQEENGLGKTKVNEVYILYEKSKYLIQKLPSSRK